MNLGVIDIIFLVVIAIFTIRCTLRGFVSELMSIAALVFGLLVAKIFFRQAAVIVRGKFMPDIAVIPEVISFIGLFMIVFIVIKIFESLLKEIIAGIHLGGLDKFLGFFFGLIEGTAIVCLFLFIIAIQSFIDPARLLEESLFAKIFMPLISEGHIETTIDIFTEPVVLLEAVQEGINRCLKIS